MKKRDLLKIIAYIKIFGLDLYGKKHTNLDCGKNNLSSYFCDKLNWSESKLKNYVGYLTSNDILRKEKVDVGMKFYSMSNSHKLMLNLAEMEVLA